MQNNNAFVAKIRERIPSNRFLLHEPMKRHTTFKIGGPADYLLLPANLEDVQYILDVLKRFEIPYMILGNGSNVLVLDGGIRGAVIKIEQPMSYIRRAENRIVAGAGALLKDIALFAAAQGLCGLEFACGIPGSLGGAVFMNAGAYQGEIKDVVQKVRAISTDGTVRVFQQDELQFGYRHSVFQENGYVIVEVELGLSQGNTDEILVTIQTLQEKRESKQPLSVPSAGSTFKRPTGYFAGTLIEACGLKGFTIGGAQVSTKHAGFVVNTGEAKASDVLTLIKEVQQRVYEKTGVHLYPEVRIIGESLQ